jgi:hypothetical protein
VSRFKFWNTIHYQYSCSKKFKFVPPEISGVTQEPVFETSTESRYFYLLSDEHYEGWLKVLKTMSHFAMEFNGREIEVIGYLYSTNTVDLTMMDSTGTGTKYVNEASFLRTFTWKLAI